jgi:hypothetical protein
MPISGRRAVHEGDDAVRRNGAEFAQRLKTLAQMIDRSLDSGRIS